MDWTATRTVGLARGETSPTGLRKAVACREQKVGSYCTTRDRPRESLGSPGKYTTDNTSAKATGRTPEGRESITNPDSYRVDRACQVLL